MYVLRSCMGKFIDTSSCMLARVETFLQDISWANIYNHLSRVTTMKRRLLKEKFAEGKEVTIGMYRK